MPWNKVFVCHLFFFHYHFLFQRIIKCHLFLCFYRFFFIELESFFLHFLIWFVAFLWLSFTWFWFTSDWDYSGQSINDWTSFWSRRSFECPSHRTQIPESGVEFYVFEPRHQSLAPLSQSCGRNLAVLNHYPSQKGWGWGKKGGEDWRLREKWKICS